MGSNNTYVLADIYLRNRENQTKAAARQGHVLTSLGAWEGGYR